LGLSEKKIVDRSKDLEIFSLKAMIPVQKWDPFCAIVRNM